MDISDCNLCEDPWSHRVPSRSPQRRIGIDHATLDHVYLVPNYHIHLMPDQAAIYPLDGLAYWMVDGISEEYDRLKSVGRKPNLFCKYPIKTALHQMQFVNDVARDLYLFCDGSRTGDEVYRCVLRKNNETYGKHHDIVRDFLLQMVAQKHLEISDVPSTKTYTSSGSEKYFIPIHASLEVTAKCNARCLHCYGSFANVRDNVLDTQSVLTLISKLRSVGVRGIELTGGECTTHPDFYEILEKALTTFDLVAILTNGIEIHPSVFDLAEKFPHNLTVQISINGRPEYHDYFVAYPNAFDFSSNSIKMFSERGIFVNVVMNVTVDNYKDIEFVLEHAINQGATMFGMAWADISQGRAQQMEEANTRPCERNKAIVDSVSLMKKLEHKYPNFVNYEMPDEIRLLAEYDKTCGAGRRAVYISSDGYFHICPMAIGTKIPCYGTVDSCLSTDFPWDTPFSRSVYKIPSPSMEICGDCQFFSLCSHCLARGIRQYIKYPTVCSWGQLHKLDRLLESADWAYCGDSKDIVCGAKDWDADNEKI